MDFCTQEELIKKLQDKAENINMIYNDMKMCSLFHFLNF